MAGTVVSSELTGAEVDAFIRGKLLPAVDGESLALVSASFLTILIHSMGPDDLTEDELLSGIREVSQSLATFIGTLRLTPQQVN